MKENLFIPNNFDQLLPELKQKTFKWRTEYTSGSNTPTTAYIEYYAVTGKTNNNLILLPGIASNTDIEPLMKMLTFWGLTHKYNIYCLNTFLSDFQRNISLDAARKNTVPEFISLTANGLNLIHDQYLPVSTPTQHMDYSAIIGLIKSQRRRRDTTR